MSMESFPTIPTGEKSKAETPKIQISRTLGHESDFDEQMTAAEAAAALEVLPGDLDNVEDALENLDLTPSQREAKNEKLTREYETKMQEEADDLTAETIRLQLMEGLDETSATNKAIIDMIANLSAQGATTDQAAGRAMHAFARHLENTAGYKKNDPENATKLNRMRDIINKIIGSNALGLGQETVTRGGEVTDIAQVVATEKVPDKQEIAFTDAEADKTNEVPAMFSLADLMREAQEPPQKGKKPRAQA